MSKWWPLAGISLLMFVSEGVTSVSAQEERSGMQIEGPDSLVREDVGELSGRIPPSDRLYEQLSEKSRGALTGMTQGPIQYQGLRLVFYPSSEVIVLEGEAAASQAGTQLKAHRILYRSREGAVEAFGDASVNRGESKLSADSLFYDRDADAVATFGSSTLVEGQSETRGIDLRYNLAKQSGRLGAGITNYSPWILEGDQMSKIGSSTFLLRDGYFTTCDLPDPHYRFRSTDIKLRQNDVIVASPIVLYFSDVPVFYLPWYVEPVERGRHSGFLRPKIGLNTLIFGSGQERNVQDVGYYYVLGDYADLKVGADWYSQSRTILRFDTRYNKRYSFQGNLHLEQVWNRLDNSSSRLVRYSHDQQLGRDSRANVDVNWSNSRSFLRRNSFDPEEILQRSFRSAASYSTRFDWGSFVAGSSADFRLDANRTDFRLPDLRLSINQRPLWGARSTTGEEQPWWTRLQYSSSLGFLESLSRAQVDSLGNPLSQIPTDSLGNPIPGDIQTIKNTQEGRGQFTLNGPLDLFGVINTTPSFSYNASFSNDVLAEDNGKGGTGQMNFGLNLNAKFFRIYNRPPGPFTALRHTVTPTVNFSYRPKPSMWGIRNVSGAVSSRESFTANFNLGQDIDVKLPQREKGSDEGKTEEEPVGAQGEKKEEGPTRTVNLLNITNSVPFDFVRSREAGKSGFSTLSTRMSSGLGQTFNVSMTLEHDLVKQGAAREVFAPFLSRITTDFSIRRGNLSRIRRGERNAGQGVLAGRGDEQSTVEAEGELSEAVPALQGIGPWSLNLTHSWDRNRGGENARQSLGIGAQLLPTPSWSLNYQTTFDITEGRLQGQTLSLVRELHDWEATLNVNVFPSEPQDRILVSFAVYLRDVPDLRVPYRVRRE